MPRVLRPARNRTAFGWAFLCLLSAGGRSLALGEPTPPELSAADLARLPREVQAWLLGESTWTVTGAVRAEAGWDDNPLLSSTLPEDAFVGRAAWDFGASRAWGERGSVQVLGLGNVVRYGGVGDLSGEQQALAAAVADWRPSGALRLGATVRGFMLDQVQDLSETTGSRLVGRWRVWGGSVESHTAWESGGWRVRAGGGGGGFDYRGIDEDFDEATVSVEGGWTRPDGGPGLTLGLRSVDRSYHSRPTYTLGGRPLRGTRLVLDLDEAELTLGWDQAGDAPWSVALVTGGTRQRDRATGFFNLEEAGARVRMTGTRDRWEGRLEAFWVRTRYDNQTAGTGFTPALRTATQVGVEAEVERRLGEAWFACASVNVSDTDSNDGAFAYERRSVTLGLGRRW